MDNLVVKLNIQHCKIICGNLDRPNIRYSVLWGDHKFNDRINQLMKLIDQQGRKGGKGLVYCSEQKTCEKVSQELQENGFSAKAYFSVVPERDKSIR